VDALIAVAGRGEHQPERAHAPSRQTDLFAQLAPRARLGRFPRVQEAGGNFPQEPTTGVTILMDQDDPPVLVDRHHGRRAGMPHHLELRLDAVRQRDTLDAEIHHAPAIHLLPHAACGLSRAPGEGNAWAVA
jgi:hypothetical protein